jgi:hypothetical protein
LLKLWFINIKFGTIWFESKEFSVFQDWIQSISNTYQRPELAISTGDCWRGIMCIVTKAKDWMTKELWFDCQQRQESFYIQNIQTGSGAYQASFLVDTRASTQGLK